MSDTPKQPLPDPEELRRVLGVLMLHAVKRAKFGDVEIDFAAYEVREEDKDGAP